MKVPFKWLGDLVDLSGFTPDQVAARLTEVGVAVEYVERRNAGVRGVVVGHVVEMAPHPNADRLRVARVDTGSEAPLQIVTGASNVQVGMLIPLAVEGATLAEGLAIKRSKLRGVESQGMMCGASELGLDPEDLPADLREGVLVFPPGTPIGGDVVDLLSLDDAVLILEPFANRPDTLGMLGVAREVAAALGRPLLPLDLEHDGADADVADSLAVTVADRVLCPLYTGRVVDGIRVGPTPLWMAGRLRNAGVRSVNNVVDITNYVMLEVGQPLHAFDHVHVRGNRIDVRPARDGEKMVSIDGKERVLEPTMLVIADAERPVAIAGVMGGLESEVSSTTTRVLLESAVFAPTSVRRTSGRLGLRSESSRRFEKGLDIHGVDVASRRACHWLSRLCGGRVLRGLAQDGAPPPAEVRVSMRPARVNRILGASVEADRMKAILEALHFRVEGGAADPTLTVTVPSFRSDVRREEDLAEEVARHYGYDNIPGTLPVGRTHPGRTSLTDASEERLRDFMVAMGLHEAVTLSLINPAEYGRLGMAPDRPMRVVNPLVIDQSELRTSLLPHLCQALAHNVRARAHAVRLFELSQVYLAREPREDGTPSEPEEARRLAMVLTGRDATGAFDFFTLKGIVEELMRRVRLHVTWTSLAEEDAQVCASHRGAFHPGKTAVLRAGGEVLGLVGVLHPQVQERLDVATEIMAAELDLGRIQGFFGALPVQYRQISRLQEVERDLALVVDEGLPAGRVEEAIRRAGGTELQTVRCFDVYTGTQIPAGRKSLAWSLSFQPVERTLTDVEIEARMAAIIQEVGASLGAQVRS